MTILADIAMLAIENNRSRAYLQRMAFHNLLPNFILLLQNTGSLPTPGQKQSDLTKNEVGKDNLDSEKFVLREHEPLIATIKRLKLDYKILSTTNVNSVEVVHEITTRPEKTWIYSGPSGAILKKPLFSTNKRFLHIHPGLVPEYRGSTTIYYSLLTESSCGASAIFLSEKIDQGPLIAKKIFAPPADRRDIDYLYDPLIRSELLVEVLTKYKLTGDFETSPQGEDSDPYYIMHPVLRHICILAKL